MVASDRSLQSQYLLSGLSQSSPTSSLGGTRATQNSKRNNRTEDELSTQNYKTQRKQSIDHEPTFTGYTKERFIRQPEIQTASRFGIILLTTVEITPDFVNACLVANVSQQLIQYSLGNDSHLEELLATHTFFKE